MSAQLDVSVTEFMKASPEAVRRIMFDARQDPRWMAAVRTVEPLSDLSSPGARVRRTGRFLGRKLLWTTRLISSSPNHQDLDIIDGPMRGTVTYRIEVSGTGSVVSIRSTGEAPRFAPRALVAWGMRRSLTADLARLRRLVERPASDR
jgi:hypothetical protein